MATVMDASCSECFTPQMIEISPRYSSIECEYCGHTVQMFEKREIAAIRSALRAERSKMYIALLILAVAAAGFTLFVFLNIGIPYLAPTLGDPVVTIPTAEGDFDGVLVSRDDESITIRTEDGEEPKFTFAKHFKDDIAKLREKKPYLSEELAAALVGAQKIRPEMPKTKASPLLWLSMLASVGAVAFSFIAGQDRVVAEF